jgi:transcriptional regulator with XRE-family HTH domain
MAMSTKIITEKFFVKPNFGSVLRRIRKKREMSLRDLAVLVGVNHSYISQIELGKVGAPVGELSMKIARILDSPELMKIADYITVRQLWITEMELWGVYQEMSDQLRTELGITDTELEIIRGRLADKLFEALLRRQDDPSKWKRSLQKKGDSQRWVYRMK